MTGLVFYDVPLPLSHLVILAPNSGLITLGTATMLYAELRHRVVDVTVVLNRAPVYAVTISLVLGLFALLESLIERSALGRSADRMLELAVPLSLGAALSAAHRRIEATVERFIFSHLSGALVVGERAGEHYAADERALLTALSAAASGAGR